MSRTTSSARFAALLAVAAILFGAGMVSGAPGQPLIIGGANDAGVSNTSLDTTSGGFAWQMFQHGAGVGVFAISQNGVALAGLAHNGNQHALSVTNDGTAGTGAAIIADGKNNTALDLRVNSSSIDPIKVNSTALVDNLNSDLVDGFQASSITRLSFNSTANAPNTNGDLITTDITAPTRGWLHITASSDGFGTDTFVSCLLRVDTGATQTDIVGSQRDMSTDGTAGNSEEDCSTNGGFLTCGGTHTVALEAQSVTAGWNWGDATIEVLFTPFSGTGSQPSLFGCIILPFETPADTEKAPE